MVHTNKDSEAARLQGGAHTEVDSEEDSEAARTHLRQDGVHGLGGNSIVAAQDPQQGQDLGLQEGVNHAAHVILRRVAAECCSSRSDAGKWGAAVVVKANRY